MIFSNQTMNWVNGLYIQMQHISHHIPKKMETHFIFLHIQIGKKEKLLPQSSSISLGTPTYIHNHIKPHEYNLNLIQSPIDTKVVHIHPHKHIVIITIIQK